MPRLSAHQLAWATGGRHVLLDVNLTLDSGTLTALTGDNGAGKSTLLNLLAGVQKPLNGQVKLDDVPLNDVAPGHLAQRIARLDHQPGLYLDLTPVENVQLFAHLLDRPVDPPRVLARLGLEPRDFHRPVRGFSRGMQQRTALARVLAVGADIWLLDEPSTGLDQQGCVLLHDLLGEIRSAGVLILLATHDPALVTLADRHINLTNAQLMELK